jgi:hypothetical protein
MEKTYFCFECQEEFTSEKVEHECTICTTTDIIDITEEVEAEKYFEELEEAPTEEDTLEWMYGNDYHRYVK